MKRAYLGAIYGLGWAAHRLGRMSDDIDDDVQGREPGANAVARMNLAVAAVAAVPGGRRWLFMRDAGIVLNELLDFPNFASFLTVNLSRAEDLGVYHALGTSGKAAMAKILLHRDTDYSDTLLLLFQDCDTPPENRVHWVDSQTQEPLPVVGLKFRIFDGRELHGLVPPLRFDPKYPWYGLAVVKVQNPSLVWRECSHWMTAHAESSGARPRRPVRLQETDDIAIINAALQRVRVAYVVSTPCATGLHRQAEFGKSWNRVEWHAKDARLEFVTARDGFDAFPVQMEGMEQHNRVSGVRDCIVGHLHAIAMALRERCFPALIFEDSTIPVVSEGGLCSP